jgi:hypothetical protein
MTDWHRKVLCNFDNAWSATQDMREQIIEAQRFVRVSGAQWEGIIKCVITRFATGCFLIVSAEFAVHFFG